MARRSFWKTFRIIILLFVLLIVAGDAWLTKLRTTDWQQPLRIVIYPIPGDGSEATDAYISNLTVDVFAPIAKFIQEEAGEYGVALEDPVIMALAPVIGERPPRPPRHGNFVQNMWWSLQMRYWAFTRDNYTGPPLDVRMFVIYHDPEQVTRVAHSLGLEKGLLGVVNAFAHDNLAAKNNVVIAHEFLHTLGATDKYDLATSQPLYPQGYAEPEKQPLYPQAFAEIMGGAIAQSQDASEMPESLEQTIVGPITAQEVNWIQTE